MLTGRQHEVALEVAKDRLTNAQIAAKAGISLRCLDKWKADPEFQAAVQRHLTRWQEDVERKGIADRRRRLYRQNDRWRRLQAVIEQRAKRGKELLKLLAESAKPGEIQEYPGIETGLFVLKPTRYGTVAEVDTGLLAEIRALEQHAAIETGQWKHKHELTGPNDGPLQFAAAKLAELFTLEELEEMRQRLLAKAAAEAQAG